MIYSKQSSRFPEEVGRGLEEAAGRHKFGVLHIHDLKRTLESKGIHADSPSRSSTYGRSIYSQGSSLKRTSIAGPLKVQ